MKKMPPIEKVYEAWTAVADERVALQSDYAVVMSSDGAKEYSVRFNDNVYSSDDNATYWQGYAGYPVIAVLMLQGRLPLNMEEANKWSGINWTELNRKHKRDYAAAVAEIERLRGIDAVQARIEADKVMNALAELPIVLKRKLA